MIRLLKKLFPLFMILGALALVEGGINADYAEAKAKLGGKSFKMSPTQKAPSQSPASGTAPAQKGSFASGLAGGLLGGALGGLLFGSMFGGSGMGLLPLLLLAGAAYFIFKRMSAARAQGGQHSKRGYAPPPPPQSGFGGFTGSQAGAAAEAPAIGGNLVEEGLAQIMATDRNFDAKYFTEVASDVFFQVQAGWMRRDISSFRHLLGSQLAEEYTAHLQELADKGQINKLESIAVRSVEIVEAGSDGQEDFVTVHFTASLLDYTVDDQSGQVVDGSNTTPIKFSEKWTWARPVGTQEWRLEGIHQ